MPYRINGFGTGYYGKANIHRIQGQCDSCKRIETLESYDTQLFITALYVPVIPIGGKRILDSCPSCTTHRAMPLAHWNRSKEEQKAELLEAMQNNPQDKATLIRALGVAIGYQDIQLFRLLRDSLVGDREDDADVQANLARASLYFGERKAAIEAFQKSLVVKNDPEIHEELALVHLRQDNPDLAAPHLEHLAKVAFPDKLWLLQLLAGAYQGKGKHSDVLDLLDRIKGLYPSELDTKEWKRIRSLSEKYKESGKRVGKGAGLGLGPKVTAKENPFGRYVGFAILPLLLIGFSAWHVGMAMYVGNNRTIHLISAWPRPYDVKLNGQQFKLQPFQRTKVTIPEGQIHLLPVDNNDFVDEARLSIETSFWTRPYTSPVFVINPDQLAIIALETAIYSEQGNDVGPPPIFYLNSNFHQFTGIDYPFEPFPPNQRVKKGQRTIKKGLEYLQVLTDMDKLNILRQAEGPKGLQEYLPRWIKADPKNPLLLRLVSAFLPPEQSEPILAKGLEERPISIEVHRTFQDIKKAQGKDQELIEKYKNLAKETGEDPSVMYLLARLYEPAESIKILRKAISSGRPAPYAHYSLAYHLHAQGKFEEAAREIDQSREITENSSGFYGEFAKEVYLSARRFKDLYRILDQEGKKDQNKISMLFQKFRYQAIEGDKAGMAETSQALQGNIPFSNPDQTNRSIAVNLKMLDSLARGDIQGYKSGENQARISPIRLAILEGHPETAIGLVDKNVDGEDSFVDLGLLLLALPAAREKDKEVVELKEIFLKEMDERRDEKYLQQMLLKKAPFDMEKVRLSTPNPVDKRLLLYLAAKWLPEHAKELKELASLLDYQKDEVSLCIKKINP